VSAWETVALVGLVLFVVMVAVEWLRGEA